MNVTFACPQCHRPERVDVSASDVELACPDCQRRWPLPEGALADGELRRCLVCPSHELFVRKDFPQRLGVTIVVAGFVASCIAWANYQLYLTFGILFLTALVDVVLYVLVGNSLICYRCSAEYRDVEGIEKHPPFELTTHERYRQQAARLSEAQASPRITS
jgi:uncharacterized protein YbaR (Trm112 family)